MLKFGFDGDIKKMSVADISKFISDFKIGNLEPLLISEEVPQHQTVDGLTFIVGKTWDTIVNDPSKDVFVFSYAPWCPNS